MVDYLPATLAGMPSTDYIQQSILWSLLGMCFNYAICTATKGTSIGKKIPPSNIPWVMYVICLIYQSLLFPIVLFASISQYPTLYSHCISSWDECGVEGTCYMRFSSIFLISYLAKDLPQSNFLEVVHHLLGIFMVFGFASHDRGMFGFVTGSIVMEGANFFMNLAHALDHTAFGRSGQNTGRKTMYLLCVIMMTISHAIGLYLTHLTYTTRGSNANIYFFLFFVVSSFGVMYFRHVLNWNNYLRVCAEEEEKLKKRK